MVQQGWVEYTLWDARPVVPSQTVLALEMLAWVGLLQVLIPQNSSLLAVSIG